MARNIPDAAKLLRRVRPDQVVPDNNTGRLRVSTAPFKDPEMSVDVEDFLFEAGETHEYSLRDFGGYWLTRLTASVPREHSQDVSHHPIEPAADEVGNPYHAEVRGHKPGSCYKALQRAAEIVVEGDNPGEQ